MYVYIYIYIYVCTYHKQHIIIIMMILLLLIIIIMRIIIIIIMHTYIHTYQAAPSGACLVGGTRCAELPMATNQCP